MASALVALAMAVPAAAQKKAKPPSRNRVLTRSVGANAATPVALVDDATLLDPGSASLSLSVSRWQGADISQVDAPIVSGAVGLTPRVQFSAAVPRVTGSDDPSGPTGGLGSVFLGGKVSLFSNDDLGVKLAISPAVVILSADTVLSMAPGSSRAQLGLPIAAELERGPMSMYVGAGYYSNGSWFTGIGGGLRATPDVYVSLGYSHAWTNASPTDPTLVDSDRHELSFGVSRALASLVSVFGSISQTVATLDEHGAGTTLAGGISLFLPAGSLTR